MDQGTTVEGTETSLAARSAGGSLSCFCAMDQAFGQCFDLPPREWFEDDYAVPQGSAYEEVARQRFESAYEDVVRKGGRSLGCPDLGLVQECNSPWLWLDGQDFCGRLMWTWANGLECDTVQACSGGGGNGSAGVEDPAEIPGSPGLPSAAWDQFGPMTICRCRMRSWQCTWNARRCPVGNPYWSNRASPELVRDILATAVLVHRRRLLGGALRRYAGGALAALGAAGALCCLAALGRRCARRRRSRRSEPAADGMAEGDATGDYIRLR